MRDIEVKITKVNDSFIHIEANSGILREISENFTFMVPGYQFMPAYKNKIWDGKLRVLDLRTNRIYTGLCFEVVQFCARKGYSISVDKQLHPEKNFISIEECKEFIASLNINSNLEARDYQIDAFNFASNENRTLLISPTASGKSFIIFLLTQLMKKLERKVLVIVPLTSLVYQMEKDFRAYTSNELNIRTIMSGKEKLADADIVISTWQSLMRLDPEWFEVFGCVIGDEAHLYKANSLIKIMNNLTNCNYRYGFTGTIDDTLTHKTVLQGLFGRLKKVTTTKKLMEQGFIANLKIKCLVLKYSDADCIAAKEFDYPKEKEFLIFNEARNKLVVNLALSMKNNTLLLFERVETHGKPLFQSLKQKEPNRKIYYISGEVDVEAREEIRRIVEIESDAIIVASLGTFSTGINIRNINNIIFAAPSRSKIRTLQSIGRGLRKAENNLDTTLYDIADDLCWKSHKNYTFDHFLERLKIYDAENFEFKTYNIRV